MKNVFWPPSARWPHPCRFGPSLRSLRCPLWAPPHAFARPVTKSTSHTSQIAGVASDVQGLAVALMRRRYSESLLRGIVELSWDVGGAP